NLVPHQFKHLGGLTPYTSHGVLSTLKGIKQRVTAWPWWPGRRVLGSRSERPRFDTRFCIEFTIYRVSQHQAYNFLGVESPSNNGSEMLFRRG
ncbi:hypothetical protein AVEN_127553-1, partial [Araneus ventricosus]